MEIIHCKKYSSYKIIKELGEGLTSRVYLVNKKHSHLDLNMKVVLKVFKSAYKVQVLKNEIKALSKVKSAHCVRLLGWEELREGSALVLEYIDGVTLFELTRYTNLSRAEVLNIVNQVQKGLDDLNHLNLVHGDLNPNNILIDKFGTVKLLDFGFSKQGRLTEVHGTPGYIAPEKLTKREQYPQSDLYSLAIIFKEMCDIFDIKLEQSDQLKLRQNMHDDISLRERFSYLGRVDHQVCLQQKVDKALSARQDKLHQTLRIKKSKDFNHIVLQQKVSFIRTLGHLIFTILFFGTASTGNSMLSHCKKHNLYVTSKKWALVKLVSARTQAVIGSYYTPFQGMQIPAGNYTLKWSSHNKFGKINVHLNKNKRIIIE